MTHPTRSHLFRILAAAVVALALLVSLRPSAEAAEYITWIAQDPSDSPTSIQTVRVWMNSDTAFGETAALEYRIGGIYTRVYGSFDNSSQAGANWRVDIPAQADGTFVEYQLFVCNTDNVSTCEAESWRRYRHTDFNWSYTVDDGDIQWDGLKHDTFDAYYRSPFGAVPADDDVTIRFRTFPLDVDGVDLRVYSYNPATNSTTGPVDYPMTYLEDRDEGGTNYAIWTYTLDTPNSPALLYYHFKVTDGLDVDWYSDDHGGPHDNLNQGGTGATSDNQGDNGFQLTVYDPAFQTPNWLKNAVVYQIFPDRFRNGDPTNDYCRSGSTTGCPLFYGDQDILLREPWNTLIGDPRTAGPYENEYGTQFYGGDLQGLIDKLDYLKAAGFDTIYTTPIFDGSSNHRYDTDDYLEIDPALGTLSDFNELIDELNAREMKLIVDGVFNHTSSDSLYFDRYHRYGSDGACESLASDYRDWYVYTPSNNTNIPCGAGDYEGWFGYDTLAVLKDDSSEVRDFIYRDANSVMETWYDRGVHGWRFDVADEISHDWWRDFRPYAKADASNGPLVGEVWPDASAFLLGDQLDSVMNYRFRKNVLGFIRQNDWNDNDNNGNNEIISLTPSQFDRALRSVREDYPPEATLAMLNLLDSHDTNRTLYTLTILGDSGLTQAKQRLALAALFQYTYMGAPMVYYGDEVGLNSPSLANGVNGPEDDPYNRAPYPWEDEAGDTGIYGPADPVLLARYTRLAQLRQFYGALRADGFDTLLTGDTTADSSDNTTYAYARHGSGDVAIVALNPGSGANTATINVDAYYAEGTTLEDMLSGQTYVVTNFAVELSLPARSGVLLLPATTTITVIKEVVGDSSGVSQWDFTDPYSNGFSLPATGGSTVLSVFPHAPLTVSETPQADWTAAASCSNGATGTDSVEVTLDTGQDVTCTFTNTYSPDITPPDTFIDSMPSDPSNSADATFTFSGDDGAGSGVASFECQIDGGGWAACNSGDTFPGLSDGEHTFEVRAIDVAGNTDPTPASYTWTIYTGPATANLTVAKATDPAGGTGFPFTLDPGTVTFADKWGSNGVGKGDFNAPFGIAIDNDGNVYVADTFAYRVQKFDADGNFILMWGKDVKTGSPTGYEVCLAAETCKAGASGTGDGEFNLPKSIAVDGDGNVYVSDSFNHRIQVFDTNGAYLDQWGSQGGAGGQFDNPNGVAVDGAGNVYVADSFNNRLQKFAGDGTFLLAWGYDVVDDGTVHADFEICTPSDTCWAGIGGNGDGQLDDPFGVAVFGGRVYVADTFNDRIQVFDADGNYLNKWGGHGSGNSQFEHPYGIAVDAAGNVYVADSFINASPNNRIQKFDADGGYLGQWGSAGSGDGQFDMPTGVAVAGDGDVYVTEYEGHRVQRFTQTGTTLDDGQSHTFTNLAPGDYLLSELVPDGWTLDDIDCGAATATRNGNTVSVTLVAGDDVTCTFSNTEEAPQDTTPPETTIDSGPTGTTNSDDATFTFSSNEAGGTFTCQLDSGATGACNSGSISYPDLAEGGHTFLVYACDAAGNCDASPATRTWTVDTTGPVVTITSAPSDPSNDTTPNFEFTSESGATFECRIDGAAFADCESGDTFGPLANGEHTFDVRATDTAGNTGAADSHTWTIDTSTPDTTPPQTTINIAPPALTNDKNPSFVFSSDETGSTFECKLDTGNWETCSIPKSYSNVADGEHTFQVRATDAAGNTDPTPASHTWTIDTAPPDTTILTYPPDPTNDRNPTFTFSSSETGSTFECKLGADDWEDCASPKSYTNIPDSDHTFQVRATDAAGNTDPTPASYHWLIDIMPPDTFITSGPPDPSSSEDAQFQFTSETGATFECRIDGDSFAPCVSGDTFGPLGNGEHTFEVRAIDTAGNPDPSPDSYTWTIDAPTPEGAIYMTALAGSIAGGPTFQNNDILRWDGNDWSVWFDGAAAGLQQGKNQVHNINAFAILDADAQDVVMAFSQNRRFVPGIVSPVDGMDLVRWDGAAFSFYFDGSDVGLTQKTPEKIDGLHILPGSASPINGGECLAYLLISTQGPGKVPGIGGGTLSFGGEDVLGFCATQLGTTTAGHWHMVVDGLAEGMPKNSTDSLSMSGDGQTLYLTTRGTFRVDSANGGHSSVYAFDMTSRTFSGPLFRAADEGLSKKVDGLEVIGGLP